MVDTRLTIAVRFYNACLHEMIQRSRLIRTTPAFKVAKQLPSGTARSQAFRDLDTVHGFTDSAAMTFASSMRVVWLREHILAQEAQVLGRRAFTAVRRWHLGLGGRPRFKSFRAGLRSLSCKDSHGSLWPSHRDGVVLGLFWGRRQHLLAFAQPPVGGGRRGREQRAEWAQVQELIVSGKVLSVAIVKSTVRGRSTYRAHLTCDGPRPQRHPIGAGRVSMDLGPSVNAVVTADVQPDGQLQVASARLVRMAPGITDTAKILRRLQRKLDRQHRAGSPACFDRRGRHVHGRCLWQVRSAAARRTLASISELGRTRAEYRKSSHGRQVNNMLAAGSIIHAEKLNYVAWQKNWGRSVHDRAPGMLVELIRGKAESAGGGLLEYSTYTTRLSQACVCGALVKKPLVQRVHRCPCGVVAQRDLFSAFLGLFVHRQPDPQVPGALVDVLDLEQAKMAWSSAHEVEWMPGSSTSTAGRKQRGQVRPSRRSVARIKARRSPARPDRAARHEVARAPVTAQVAA
ncbi:MAG: transposase [Nakamurella sp.]